MAGIMTEPREQSGMHTQLRPLLRLALGAGMLLLLAVGWQVTAVPVRVTVDGLSETVTTHRTNVAALLLDLGLTPNPADALTPALDASIEREMTIELERARPLRLLADGRDRVVSSRGATVGAVLADAGIAVDAGDRVLLNGQEATPATVLPEQQVDTLVPTYDRGMAWSAMRAQPVELRLYRAVPMTVHEGGLPYVINATAQTVGEALRQAEVTLYLGDEVFPTLGSRVTSGMHVYIQRSIPVTLQVDGRQIKTRTQAQTVGDALADLEIAVTGLDTVNVPLALPLFDNIRIQVTRIREDVEIAEEIAPFETVFTADSNLAIDTQEVLASGAPGITRSRYRVRYENGEEVDRVLEDTWVAQEPADRRIAYGQGIIPQTAVVDGQAITYWRKVQMLATSYNAASAGGNRTRTGDTLRDGIVAVDPRIIPLRSQVFVPGYGVGDALDTGGGIIARRIDLAFSDARYESWRRWVDVYLLWPPPADGDITWVLPNYPPVPE